MDAVTPTFGNHPLGQNEVGVHQIFYLYFPIGFELARPDPQKLKIRILCPSSQQILAHNSGFKVLCFSGMLPFNLCICVITDLVLVCTHNDCTLSPQSKMLYFFLPPFFSLSCFSPVLISVSLRVFFCNSVFPLLLLLLPFVFL